MSGPNLSCLLIGNKEEAFLYELMMNDYNIVLLYGGCQNKHIDKHCKQDWWRTTQKQLSQTDLISKVAALDVKTIEVQRAKHAKEILDPFTREQVAANNKATVGFYDWVGLLSSFTH